MGTHILAHLLKIPTVSKVYALNRRSSNGPTLETRQSQAFADRGFDPGLVKSSKVMLVECDFAEKKFNLIPELYEEVSRLFLESSLLTLRF